MNKGFYRLLAIVSVCCVLSVISAEPSYNYFNVGVSLSDNNSEYLTDDLNFYGDVNFCRDLSRILQQIDKWSIHFWVDTNQSRNLSEDPAYEVTLSQSGTGFGIHYIKHSFSVFFRLGTVASHARFKVTSNRASSGPSIPTGSQDIFLPPLPIFSSTSRPKATYANQESGLVNKIGVRYRTSSKYEIGAAFHVSEMHSFGNELSAYIQRDFENLPLSARSTLGIRGGYLSMVLDARISEHTKSLGISLAYSF